MQYFETKNFKIHSLSSHWLKTNGFYAQLYKKAPEHYLFAPRSAFLQLG